MPLIFPGNTGLSPITLISNQRGVSLKIDIIRVVERVIFCALLPFFFVLAYDFSVFATVANSSIKGSGGNAITLLMISAITYGFACVVALPALLYIYYVSNRRKEKVTTRSKLLTAAVLFVVSVPLLYAIL